MVDVVGRGVRRLRERGRVGSGRAQGYLVAIVAVAVALAVRLALQPILLDRPLLIFFVPAVLAAALWGGFGPGLLATALSLAGSALLLGRASWGSAPDLINAIAFLAVGSGIAWFGEPRSMKPSERQ